ncbi:glycosylation associated protein, mature Fap1 export and glycosylation,gap3 [Streptococcus dysgalactiae subsp. dysgalactiae]|uniref:Glycosylation associated protein, mature Fap1 export and glycosylation,gap3 n=1 Tax=Streptococcus dysgalactiae subsp. dysgalactiae TaxID=99822 RepID=A0A380JY18_STRDY|nr:accessory Sec system protein Asp3 [Streptococcus dysgalactiae]SUN51790.1 glycosylation associated protein, mature Fap1 export and glycosylation,gap3 [Streptococcus dysgalactiae subsp. dysgalactiae]
MSKSLILNLKSTELSRWDTYLYGTYLSKDTEGLLFDNPCLTPGKALLGWYSKRHYQMHRVCPDLPLIIPGHHYQLSYHVQVLSEGTCYLQVRFKNQQDEVIEVLTVRERECHFTCPADTYHYDISLMTAGCHRLLFQGIKLYACDTSESWQKVEEASSYREQDLPEDLDLIRFLIPLT